MATVLITGAGRGIGLELSRQLHARGDTVLATCRRASPALSALGVEVHDGVEVTSDEAVSALAERLSGRALDVLILNAGVLQRNGLDNLDWDSLRHQFEVNALGPLRVAAALRGNLGRGAKIAIVTSRMGSVADNTSGSHYGYRMSKSAVNMAGRSLSHDLRPHGVAVCLLHPGYVRTGMTGGHGYIDPDEAAVGLIARIDDLDLGTSGGFWHANGDVLPW